MLLNKIVYDRKYFAAAFARVSIGFYCIGWRKKKTF